jgi:hypothetical protein
MIDAFLYADMYSPLEVAIIIILTALPMSRVSEILLGVLEKKTGMSLTREKD